MKTELSFSNELTQNGKKQEKAFNAFKTLALFFHMNPLTFKRIYNLTKWAIYRSKI